MQTFLPYPDFAETAAVLDVRRLGKQRVEVLQILRALTFDDYGWRTHPAVTMWVGFTEALVTYGVAITRCWIDRGFSDTVLPQLLEFSGSAPPRSQETLAAAGELPDWLGWELLHVSHQAALVRKDPDYYGPLFPDADPDVQYVWPESTSPEPASDDVSAWVVRATPADLEVMRQEEFVGLRPAAGEEPASPVGAGNRSTKRRRQVSAFVHEVDQGDRVVIPDGDQLLVAEVVADYEWWDEAPHDLHHARRVRWVGALQRADLSHPVHLQDPRVVFALRGEPAVASCAGLPTAPPAPAG